MSSDLALLKALVRHECPNLTGQKCVGWWPPDRCWRDSRPCLVMQGYWCPFFAEFLVPQRPEIGDLHARLAREARRLAQDATPTNAHATGDPDAEERHSVGAEGLTALDSGGGVVQKPEPGHGSPPGGGMPTYPGIQSRPRRPNDLSGSPGESEGCSWRGTVALVQETRTASEQSEGAAGPVPQPRSHVAATFTPPAAPTAFSEEVRC